MGEDQPNKPPPEKDLEVKISKNRIRLAFVASFSWLAFSFWLGFTYHGWMDNEALFFLMSVGIFALIIGLVILPDRHYRE